MLVLAVAVVVAEDVVGRVRLISSDAERDSNVAVLRAHEAVKGTQLGVVVRHALSEL